MLVQFDRDTSTFPQCWHSALPFRDRMSRTAEPSRVQLCLCNPNTGRNAKSSFPAQVSHHSFCAVQKKRGPGRVRDRLSEETSWRVISAKFLVLFRDSSACHLIQFLLTVTLSECGLHGSGRTSTARDTFTNCSGLSCSGGSVNMTFSVCVQRQHKY